LYIAKKSLQREENLTLSAPVMACGSVTVARFALTPGPGSHNLKVQGLGVKV